MRAPWQLILAALAGNQSGLKIRIAPLLLSPFPK